MAFPSNLGQFLIRAGRSDSQRPALAIGERTVADYGTLARRASALAAQLRGRFGLESGARVALAMTNCPQFLEVLNACWLAGLAAVPMNAKLHPKEFAYILEDSGARVLFATEKLADGISAQASGLGDLKEIVRVETPAYEQLCMGDAMAPDLQHPDSLAWLFYTSGTTGKPKGAMLSHRNLLMMSYCYFIDVEHIAPGDSIIHAAPMSHGSGLYSLPHLAATAVHVIPESRGFEAEEIFSLIKAHRGVGMFAAPTMVKRLVESPVAEGSDVGNLKSISYGGGPMYVEDIKRAMDRLGNRFVQIYGQGESPMTITSLTRSHHAERDHPRWEARLGSVGRRQTCVEIAIVGADDEPLPAGEVGEVLVRGEQVMNGYWNREDATAESLRGGWLHTGDVGSLDDDGFLTLKDRSKDVIISGGANIYPREVEEVLLTHPAVLEVSVVGAPHPDWGEEVIAFVVARPNARLEETELDRHCLREMARFKRPKRYRFINALPKNAYGKVLKTELRAALEADAG
jgi:long-chain acyl-CoA synthetase